MKKLFSLIFVLLIVTPIVLAISKIITNKNYDLTLSGYFDNVPKTAFSKEKFLNKSFQSEFENYFLKTFSPRGLFIKTYNQLQFSFFKKGNSLPGKEKWTDRIIGKNNYIYEYAYIDEECHLDDFLNYDSENKINGIKNYIEHLISINKKLNQIGKHLLIYTTPTKAHFYKENIPYKYLCQEKDGKRGIDCFRKLIKNTELNYLDTEMLAEKCNYPLFYSTGTHWARPIEQEVSVEIVNQLKLLTGKNIPTLQLGRLKTSNVPYWRDADLYWLSNLLLQRFDKEYYEYDMEEIIPENLDSIVVLVQGGSFGEGFLKDYLGFGGNNFPANRDFYHISYGISVRHKAELNPIKPDFSDLDLSFIKNVDCVVIEINEAVIHAYSSGFVEYLDNFLDNYENFIRVDLNTVRKISFTTEAK